MKTPILTVYKGRLPHWRMENSVYFVTWHLAASQVPLEGKERTLVADTIKHFAGVRYNLAAYVVMDDHVHVLVAPSEKLSLQEIIHSWKSFTTNQFQKNFGRIGVIWQREYFDRIVRDECELIKKVNYILSNPARRWPDLVEYEWVDCSFPLVRSAVGPAETPAPTGRSEQADGS